MIVMKFGGTSVADAERIKRAARAHRGASAKHGHRVVAVLSARGKTTDELIAMAEEVSDAPDPREMDMLLSSGERISCALCAMAINDLGHRAISLTGSQAGIVTDESHTKARIIDVRADRITRRARGGQHRAGGRLSGRLEHGAQRDDPRPRRIGHEAVAVAAALGAEVCEIYTDVAGVYSADPRIVPEARKLETVSFEEMLEMAASGAGVLQLRSVEYARNHGVRIHCRSSFDDDPVPWSLAEGETMEQPLITAVTHSTSEARMTLIGVPDEPGAAARIFAALAEANVNVDMIVQNEPASAGGLAEISFTLPREDLRVASAALDRSPALVHRADSPRGDGQGLDRRRGHALAPGRRRQGVRRARGRRSQHRHDLHLADQDLLRDRRATESSRPYSPAQRLRARGRGHGAVEEPFRPLGRRGDAGERGAPDVQDYNELWIYGDKAMRTVSDHAVTYRRLVCC